MPTKIKILLAEDEPALALIIKESLETRDFQVTHCSNGEEAFDTFTKHKFDLLVLDVMMPKKDGFSVANDVRKTDKKSRLFF